MKLVTTAQQLRSALSLFRQVIEPRNTYPILGTVLFDDGTVRGTNLDQEMVVALVASETKGRAAIDYRSLSRLVALIPTDDVVTIAAGKEQATVSFTGSRYDLPCCEPESFPEPMDRGSEATEATDAKGLSQALRFVAPAISREELRYYLNGVSFQRDQGKSSVLVATDGHKLSCMPFTAGPWVDGMIVPRHAVDVLLKIVEPERIERLPLQSRIRFAWSGMSLTTKLIEGTFPQWKRVVPSYDATPSLTFDSIELARALTRLAALRRRDPYVELAFDPRGVVLVARHPNHGTGREFLAKARANGASTEQAVCFRADYLNSLIKSFSGHDSVRLDLIDAQSPMRISAGGDTYTILMPARGQNEKFAFDTLHEVTAMGRVA